jgi:hypothetical protein
VAIWLGNLHFPFADCGTGLEASWCKGLLYFHQHNLQAGKDYLFTYGPLGCYLVPRYDRDFFWNKVVWELLVKFVFALTGWCVLRRLPGWPLRFLFGATLLALNPWILFETTYLFILVCFSLISAHARQDSLASIVATASLAAVLSLMKFNLALLSFAMVGCLCLSLIIQRLRWRAFAPLIAYVLSLIVVWMAAGQQLRYLPGYLRGSLEIARSYTEAMSIYGNRTELFLAVAGLAMLGVALAVRPSSQMPPAVRLGCTGILLSAAFLAWKQGFVRHDLHSQGFFVLMTLFPFLLPAFLGGFRWRINARTLLLPAIVLLSAGGFLVTNGVWSKPSTLESLAAQIRERYFQNATMLMAFDSYHQGVKCEDAKVEGLWALPRVAAEVRQASIDMISNEQALLLFNQLNWQPRPVYQSYAAHSAVLLGKNLKYFRGDRAPEYVLIKLGTLDGRFPSLDDGPVLCQLLTNYEPLFAEKSYILLRQRARHQAAVPAEKRTKRTIKMGEQVELAGVNETFTKARFRMQPSWLGKLRSIFFKPPTVDIRVRFTDKKEARYRLIPGMAEAGFLLTPLLESNQDLINLYRGGGNKRVSSFCITTSKRGRSSWKPDILMTLESNPALDPAAIEPGLGR